MEDVSAHGRLLYRESTLEKLDLWSNELTSIDQTLFQSSKLHVANDELTFYFFTMDFNKDSPFWIGREVIGFESVLPDGLKTFDSFSGLVYTYDFEGVPQNTEDIFRLGKVYTAQIPEAHLLAPTWCMKLKGIDHGQLVNGVTKTPFTRFQFFKKT